MSRQAFFVVVGIFFLALVGTAVLWPKESGAVTVYCATDDAHAIPILDAFEKETGIPVIREFDTEATKTVGLVRRLMEEKANPKADVFWNNELLHMIRLANAGLLDKYVSPSAAEIPDNFKDAGGLWTGFAARARILIVNTDLIPNEADRPKSMHDLTDPKWKGKGMFVRPLTGTTLTHAVTLSTVLGKEGAGNWFDGLHANRVNFPSGNAYVARSVAGGQAWFGFTDTDDYRKVLIDKFPVAAVYPDQGEGQPGTLVIPNTVALIRGGPRPDLGRKLIDFLLSPKVEEMLAAGDSAQIPLRESVPRPEHVKGPPAFRAMEVDWADVVEHHDERLGDLEKRWSQ